MRALRPIAVALLATAVVSTSVAGQTVAPVQSPGPLGVPLFAAPAVFGEVAAITSRIAAGRSAEAMAEIAALRDRAPASPLPDVLAAIAAASAGDDAGALGALEAAAALGFADLEALLATPPFGRLRQNPRMADLLQRPVTPLPVPTIAPATVTTAAAPVEPGNTAWLPDLMRLQSRFVFPDPPPRPRRLGVRPDDAPETQQLARLVARGRAAGHYGDLYDNRDRGHSRLRVDRFPLLTAVVYGAEAVAAGVDYGLNEQMLFDAPTIGNSSTAYTVRSFWRSLARLGMTRPGGAQKLHDLYARNHLYVYPEHRDHDSEYGDIFPANTPYVLVSQGSSGSDQAHLRALVTILGALRPDTKAYLRQTGLVAPTLQMLYRRHRTGIDSDEDYLDGRAHPAAFGPEGIDLPRLVEAANALEPEAVPPAVRLALREEGFAAPAPPLPGGSADERLFDTPGAIARVALGLARDRRYVLSARDTTDPNGNPLRVVWRVLRGQGVRLSPLGPDGLEAVIEVPWQGQSPVPGRPDLTSSRVDVGVFAHNGRHYSAPAFFSVYFPQDQTRTYNAAGRLLSVDYATPARPKAYVDPWLSPHRPWRDVFDHAPDGTLLGWRREQGKQPPAFFDAEGFRLDGPQGRRLDTEPAAYETGPRRNQDGRATIREATR